MEKFELLTEDKLNNILQTKEILESKGDYGCDCLFYNGNLIIDGDWLNDKQYYSLTENKSDNDIGTIAINGNLTINDDLRISDRLFCLIIMGDLKANNFETFETETYVDGDFKVKTYRDYDGYLKIKGENFANKI